MNEHIVVVGASLAGLRLAEALRREGYAGRLTMIGAESERPYDRPPLSKQFLSEGWAEEKLTLSGGDGAGLDAEWKLGCEAQSLACASRTLSLAHGERIEDATVVVLATGARAHRLPFGREISGIYELRTLADARSIRSAMAQSNRVVVVGAGFIGMEVAASCRAKGLEVRVVDPLPAPLIRGLGSVLGERVAVRHREEGVQFFLDLGVEAFEGTDAVTGVRLSNGAVLPADLVVVGVGASPATEWLEDSGLEIDNGVVCDSSGFTGQSGVYAVGDCARWENASDPAHRRYEHWTSAVEQAAVLARRIVHGHGEAADFSPIPYVWTDQFDLRIAIAGEIREGDEMWIGCGDLKDDRFLALFGRKGKLAGAVGFRRPRQLNACRKSIALGKSFRDAVAEFE